MLLRYSKLVVISLRKFYSWISIVHFSFPLLILWTCTKIFSKFIHWCRYKMIAILLTHLKYVFLYIFLKKRYRILIRTSLKLDPNSLSDVRSVLFLAWFGAKQTTNQYPVLPYLWMCQSFLVFAIFNTSLSPVHFVISRHIHWFIGKRFNFLMIYVPWVHGRSFLWPLAFAKLGSKWPFMLDGSMTDNVLPFSKMYVAYYALDVWQTFSRSWKA